MQLLRILRVTFPEEEWTKLLSEKRLKKAHELYDERKRRNEGVDLLDCLQMCDKRDVIARHGDFLPALGFSEKDEFERKLKQIEALRNDLAHGQDIIRERQEIFFDLVKEIDELVRKCEDIG